MGSGRIEGGSWPESEKRTPAGVFSILSRARGRFSWRLLYIAGGFALLAVVYGKPVVRTGDGPEYVLMSQSLIDHATPDLRTEDILKVIPILEANGVEPLDPYHGYQKGKDGRYYSLHFWIYPLVAVPARFLLRILGGNELKGFQIANALFFLLAIYSILFRGRFSFRKRIFLAAFSAISPVLLYFCRPTTEMFAWSIVLLSLVEIENRNYIGGALWASVAAMQNPPIMFLAVLAAVLSFRRSGLKSGFPAAAAALLSLVPAGLSYAIFGYLNPIIAAKPSYRLISLWRTWSFLTDPNQGLLLFLPFIVILLLPAAYRAVRFPDPDGIGMWAVAMLMIASIQLTGNWNSGGAGMMRYAVWILPVLAWIVSDVPARGRGTLALGIFAVAFHGLLLRINDYPPAFLAWRPPAAFLLRTAPVLYSPEPEIFVERQLGMEVNAWRYRDLLPVAFILPDGNITKLILDGKHLSRLSDYYDVDPAYSKYVLDHNAQRRDVFCLTPPRGAIKDPNGGRAIPRSDVMRKTVRVRFLDPPAPIPGTLLIRSDIQIVNTSQFPLSNIRRGNLFPLLLASRIRSIDDPHDFSKTERRPALNGPLGPGESLTIPAEIALPKRAGEYLVEWACGLYGVSWADSIKSRVRIEKDGRRYAVSRIL